MKKILIIGAGFAGLAAGGELSRSKVKLGLDIKLIDQGREFSFLPMLPDAVGGRVSLQHLGCDLTALTDKSGFKFVMDKVSAVDLKAKQVICPSRIFDYDFLIIASGSQTNFYGNQDAINHGYKLDDLHDANLIHKTLSEESFDVYLVCGGGYTGIEVATNLKAYLMRKKKNKRVIILERTPAILGLLPEWMKKYVLNNLQELDIEIMTNASIDRIEGRKIILADKTILNNTMLIWAAGVRTADFIQNLKAEKSPQGRIKVDAYLRLDENCFVVGDAAYVEHNNSFLRMAVQFAICQGRCAGDNIARSIRGRGLVKYAPRDLGYIIPMANNKSCGTILGVNVRGFLPTLMHYAMCIYRMPGMKNKFGIFNDLTRRKKAE